jgi:CRISPR type III-B/RAMP module-associated protein Cmr5
MKELEMDRDIKHQCAEYAYRCIEDVVNFEPDIKEDYRSEVMNTGTRIYGSGLMQTLTFLCSKIEIEKNGREEKPHFRKLALHLMKWILDEKEGVSVVAEIATWDDSKDKTLELFKGLLNEKNVDELIYYTQRAMEISEWLKRFADAKLKRIIHVGNTRTS